MRATGAKGGKTCNPFQTTEKTEPIASAGKFVTGAKGGKTCSRCQAGDRKTRGDWIVFFS